MIVEVFVFKTLQEPNLGRMTLFKVISGELKPGTDLYNHQTEQMERLSHLFVMDGHKRSEVDSLTAGDIGATLKLKNTHTNNTLSDKKIVDDVMPIAFPDPRVYMAVIPEQEGEEEKISDAFHKIMEEDPTVTLEHSAELKQMIIGVQGELHLSVIKWMLENVYNLNVKFIAPRISYRETIQQPAIASYRHKKQSGGAGQFAEVYMKIEPYVEGAPNPKEYNVRGKEVIDLAWGGKLEFLNCIVGGAIDARFLPSILKGVMEKMENGPLTGSYIRDVRVIVCDGKMHSVDSNDIAFKMAGLNAFKEAFMNASPQLLEPVNLVTVTVPEELMGEVMTDLQSRRAMIMGMESEGNLQIINAKVPVAEMDRYSTSLQSLTQGRGRFTQKFEEYAAVNPALQKELQKVHSEDEVSV
jgi:elongation factor G